MSNHVLRRALCLGTTWFCACSSRATLPAEDGAILDDGGGMSDVSAERTIGDAAIDPNVDLAACMDRPPAPPAPECMGCPGERPGGNCVLPQRDGGLYGRCREEGEIISGKIVGAYCCNHRDGGGIGFIITSQIVNDAGTCTQTAPDDILICSVCGDGICTEWENRCNCARDCM